MNIPCSSIVDEYLIRVRGDFTVLDSKENCRIITPLRRPDGEAVELIIEKGKNNKVRLSDEFNTSDYLFVNGLNLEANKKLNESARRLAKLRGVAFENSELYIETEAGQEAEAMSKLLSAIEALNYFIYRRSHRAPKSFSEEVELFLAENSVSFVPDYGLQGETIEHIVPIYINSTRNVVVAPLSSTSVAGAQHILKEMAWVNGDIKKINPNIRFNALLDDRRDTQQKIWSDDTVNKILMSAMDNIVTWEGRNRILSIIEEPLGKNRTTL